MEQIIQYLIYLHAFLGGIGLLTGAVSIVSKKGGFLHVKSGKTFSVTMIGSALLSLFIAVMPSHENLFLFLIGVFTIYLVLAGNRALTLRYPKKQEANFTDKGISGAMLLGSVAMLLVGGYGVLNGLANSVLFLFFGVFGIILTVTDFNNFRKFKEDKNIWLKSHIGRIVGALIASVTAFLVAGLNFKNIIAWTIPTIAGTIFIVFWTRKVAKR